MTEKRDLLKVPLRHRTIREFTEERVDEETVNLLLEVANHTATSTGMQSYSIVRVKDEAQRKAIAEVCGQEYVARATELWIFIVDAYRNSRIAREQGVHLDSERDMDRFFQGYVDGSLAAQNVTNAVEALGMGAVYFGSVQNNVDKIIEILELPELTFPIVGLGFGVPNQEPQMKPRMPMKLKVFEDRYETYDNYLELIADYDKEMETYYDLRDANNRVDCFSKQVVARLNSVIPERTEVVNSIRTQGFDLNLKSE